VQRVAHVEQGGAGLGEARSRGVGEPGGGDRTERRGVAQAAERLLEVGFEEEPEFAVAAGAFVGELEELGEAAVGLGPPGGEGRAADGRGEGGVAGDVAGVEEAELDLQVGGGGLRRPGGGADGVVQCDALVPDGVPDAVGEGRDGPGVRGGVVEEDQVEVAGRGEFGAALAADGDEGGAGGGCAAVEGDEPLVGGPGEGGAARGAGSFAVEDAVSDGAVVGHGASVGGGLAPAVLAPAPPFLLPRSASRAGGAPSPGSARTRSSIAGRACKSIPSGD
jgi:hypothetical protein